MIDDYRLIELFLPACKKQNKNHRIYAWKNFTRPQISKKFEKL